MAVDPKRYFNALRSYLNTGYFETKRDDNRIVLEENIFLKGQTKSSKQTVRLGFDGEAIALRLDQPAKKGVDQRLFHFLEDDAKPWAKRCDFVVFQLRKKTLNVYCIEFKSSTLPTGLVEQLKASENWCRSVHGIIKIYTGLSKRLNLRKFVFSSMLDPYRFLEDDKFIKRDHCIRHYHYDELKGMKLDDLDNPNVEIIS